MRYLPPACLLTSSATTMKTDLIADLKQKDAITVVVVLS
jgi:hypothetical protein